MHERSEVAERADDGDGGAAVSQPAVKVVEEQPLPVLEAEIERWLGVEAGRSRACCSWCLSRSQLQVLFGLGAVALVVTGLTVSRFLAVRYPDGGGLWDALWLAVPGVPALLVWGTAWFAFGWPVRLEANAGGLRIREGLRDRVFRWSEVEQLRVEVADRHTCWVLVAPGAAVRFYNESGSLRRLADAILRILAATAEGRALPDTEPPART